MRPENPGTIITFATSVAHRSLTRDRRHTRVTAMISSLSASFHTNGSTLRYCIKKIQILLGEGTVSQVNRGSERVMETRTCEN